MNNNLCYFAEKFSNALRRSAFGPLFSSKYTIIHVKCGEKLKAIAKYITTDYKL